MLAIHVENLSDLAIIECQGRIVGSESVFKLRDVVRAQTAASVIALDLSAVHAIGGGGLGNRGVSRPLGTRPRYSIQAVQPLQIGGRRLDAKPLDAELGDCNPPRNDG